MRHETRHRIRNGGLLLCMALGAVSCGDEGWWSSLRPGAESVRGREVTLRLEVAVLGDKLQTRAYPDVTDGSFENPATEYERLHTLRVIIVDKTTGKVDHNRMVNVNAAGNVLYDNLDFRIQMPATASGDVKPSAVDKTVWLFGNENVADIAVCDALVSGGFVTVDEVKTLHDRGGLGLDLMTPGSELPADILRSVELRRDQESPIIDNNVSDRERLYIPMNEVFDVTVDPDKAVAGEGGDVYMQSEKLFLTRSLVKFTFSAKFSDVLSDDPMEWSIKSITIDKIARSGYLIPKNTVYNPEKSDLNVVANSGRHITDFDVPTDAGNTAYTFSPTGFRVLESDPAAGAANVYETSLYFPETRIGETEKFNVTVTMAGKSSDETQEDLEIVYGPVELSDLDQLPRNTHVYVNLIFNPLEMDCEVEVIPFTSVLLKPDYGLEREEFTGYIVGYIEEDIDGDGEKERIKCWYDPAESPNDPSKRTPLYLGPKDNPGEFVLINGIEYLLVYAAYERTAANLDHIFEQKTRKKYLLSPAGRTGYENVNWTFYLNDQKQRVWLDEDYNEWNVVWNPDWVNSEGEKVGRNEWVYTAGKWYRTLNEWNRLDWNRAVYDKVVADPRIYPKYWFDVLGKRYPWSEGDTKAKRAAILGEWVKYLE